MRQKNTPLKKRTLIYIVLILFLAILGIFILSNQTRDDQKYLSDFLKDSQNQEQQNTENIEPQATGTPVFQPELPEPEQLPEKIILAVPYINEAPSNNWTGPWKDACEEASIAMVEKYYQGKKEVSIKEAEEYMQMLFDFQDQLYGTNHDADAERVKEIIEKATSYMAEIRENPTIEDIKEQIRQKNPVITPHYGYDLKNPNIPFLRTGSYYHMMVIIGYDDETQEFIVNDTGDIKAGAAHRYNYELFMNSIHDFDFSTKKADGPARAIFTIPKNEQKNIFL